MTNSVLGVPAAQCVRGVEDEISASRWLVPERGGSVCALSGSGQLRHILLADLQPPGPQHL